MRDAPDAADVALAVKLQQLAAELVPDGEPALVALHATLREGPAERIIAALAEDDEALTMLAAYLALAKREGLIRETASGFEFMHTLSRDGFRRRGDEAE